MLGMMRSTPEACVLTELRNKLAAHLGKVCEAERRAESRSAATRPPSCRAMLT